MGGNIQWLTRHKPSSAIRLALIVPVIFFSLSGCSFIFGSSDDEPEPVVAEPTEEELAAQKKALAEKELLAPYELRETLVFYDNREIKEADALSFETLVAPFAKDQQHVYLKGKVFAEAETSSTESLGSSYIKDANNVYFSEGFELSIPYTTSTKGMDCEGWVIIDGIAYYYGRKNDANAKTLECLNDAYVRDKNYVYRFGKPIENFDFDSEARLELLNDNFIKSRDKIWFIGTGSTVELGLDPTQLAVDADNPRVITDGQVTFGCMGSIENPCRILP